MWAEFIALQPMRKLLHLDMVDTAWCPGTVGQAVAPPRTGVPSPKLAACELRACCACGEANICGRSNLRMTLIVSYQLNELVRRDIYWRG